MSENQERILEKMAEALPNMSEFEKGYLTCLVETRAYKGKSETEKENNMREAG